MIFLPHLETNATLACQLRCANCNHFVSMQVGEFKESFISPEALERDLYYLSRVCHVNGGYAMIGGEPTLHPQIVGLLRIARESRISDSLEVWTNGIGLWNRFPEGHEFWRSFDSLILSRYPGKLSDEDVQWIEGVCAFAGISLRIMDESKSPNWTQLLDSTPSDDHYAQLKYSSCWFKTYCHVLDRGYFGRCCTSPFIPKLLQSRPFGSDMLRVDENLSESDLQAYLDRKVFMESCRICAGRETPSAVPVVWEEERGGPEAWLKRSSGQRQ